MVQAYDLDRLALNAPGALAGVLAALAFAAYSLLSEYGMRRYNPWTVLVYALLFAALAWNIIQPPLHAFLLGHAAPQWGLILFVAVGGTILPFGLYFEGIQRIRPTRAGVTATLEPIAAGVIAYLFLGEVLDGWQILGGAVVIAAIILLQTKPAPAAGPPCAADPDRARSR
jgi:drug/metabolite transporter (DMT)-like permease